MGKKSNVCENCKSKKWQWSCKYKCNKCLGSGGNANVCEVVEKETNKVYALKYLSNRSPEKNNAF